MLRALSEFLKQPYWVIALVLGTTLIILPCVTIGKDQWTTHAPNTWLPVIPGFVLLAASLIGFGFTLLNSRTNSPEVGAGLDLARVQEMGSILWTTVGGCEIRVVEGRIDDYSHTPGVVVVLPCNEYFDDRCAADTRSALGAFVNRAFDGQADAFVSLMTEECSRKLGPGVEQQKDDKERATSFGVGRCVLLTNPLNRSVSVALVSTTTQRAGLGLASRISYMFEGMRELFTCLANARLYDIVMPVLGGGHGRISPPLAFIGLLIALAEAARYGHGGQRPKSVTIVVFKKDADSKPEVDRVVVRRALALVSSD
jgi:hypothetical protein